MVSETQAPGASVSIVARRHDVNSNQLFRWRRQLLPKAVVESGAMVPVEVAPDGTRAGDGRPRRPEPARGRTRDIRATAPVTPPNTRRGPTRTSSYAHRITAADPTLLNNDPITAEAVTSLQLVRTLNGGAFPTPLDQGEQGVLEGYLRAIEQATKYIYIENQYFTNNTIASALVAALNDSSRPNLQIIFMLTSRRIYRSTRSGNRILLSGYARKPAQTRTVSTSSLPGLTIRPTRYWVVHYRAVPG